MLLAFFTFILKSAMVKQVVTQAVKQTNTAGELTHLLTLEGMPKEQIVHILDTAQQFVSVTDPAREVKKSAITPW